MDMDHERYVCISSKRAEMYGAHEAIMQEFIWGAVKHAPQHTAKTLVQDNWSKLTRCVFRI
jgi:hypothetical protein